MNDGKPPFSDCDTTSVPPIKAFNGHVNWDTILKPHRDSDVPQKNSDNDSKNQTITDKLMC